MVPFNWDRGYRNLPTITIKNIPDDLYEDLKQTATLHRRSINSEVIYCIEQTVRSRQIDPHEYLHRVENLRRRIKVPPLTDALLRQAKAEGRP
jgi:plasmid stability protein